MAKLATLGRTHFKVNLGSLGTAPRHHQNNRLKTGYFKKKAKKKNSDIWL